MNRIAQIKTHVLLSAVLLIICGCSGFSPQPVDEVDFMKRSVSAVSDEVTVTVAVPTIKEAKHIYGVDLALKNIQPVWLEVTNSSDDICWFLPYGLDPNYFLPSEAAYAFHVLSKKTNREIDRHFIKLGLRNPCMPGTVTSGFVLVNLDEGFKAVDIDLISRRSVRNFTFITHDPDFKGHHKYVDFNALYKPEEIVRIEDTESLVRELENLPGCTSNAKGTREGDPLNLVMIGQINDILAAIIRRNWHAAEIIWPQAIKRTFNSYLRGQRYRYSPVSALYLYGRPQDLAFQKARGSISERNHMRFWLSPLIYKGRNVFVGQISRDIGVKFTFKSKTISTHVIDPDVDEARRYFSEDMAYSQALSGLEFVRGTGRIDRDAPKENLVGDPYYTDGFRAVLFFESRPFSLRNIEILKWGIPSDQEE